MALSSPGSQCPVPPPAQQTVGRGLDRGVTRLPGGGEAPSRKMGAALTLAIPGLW